MKQAGAAIRRPVGRTATAYGLAALAGWGASRLHIPLPWMIGPLLVTAGLSIAGIMDHPLPVRTRPFGQAVVATTVGLAFTDRALAVVLGMLPLLVGLTAITTIFALAVSVVQARLAGVQLSRMVLATFPVAPVEAAVIAESRGLPVAPVILAQSLRIAAIVVLIPTLLYAIDGFSRPDRAGATASQVFDDPMLVALPLIGLAGGYMFRRLGWANPWFLGPLSLAAGLTAVGIELPRYPPFVLAGAQVILGAWLGSTFQADLLRAARRELAISVLGTLGFLMLACGSAAALARLTPLDWRLLVLGIAPGGVTEMALTARFLHQDMSVVTAAHVVRIFLLMPLARPLIRWIQRFD